MSAAKEKANEKEKELPPEDRVLLDKYLRERQAEFRTVVTTVVGLFALVGALVVWSVQKSGELAGQTAAQAGADRQIARVDQQISDKGKEISQIVNLAQQSALDSANRATQLVEQRLKEKGDELTRIVTTAQAFAQESSIKAAQLVVEVERLREAAQAETKNAEALRQTAIALDEQIGKSKELLSGRVDDIAASLATRPEFKAIAEAAIGLLPPGTILGLATADTPIPAGWVPCDGATVNDAASPFNGKRVPNLVGRFPRGAELGQAVGTERGNDSVRDLKTLAAGSHTHKLASHSHQLPAHTGSIFNGGPDPGNRPYKAKDDGAGWSDGAWLETNTVRRPQNEGQHYHELGGQTAASGDLTTSDSGSHEHAIAQFDHVPRYVAIRFIVKIK